MSVKVDCTCQTHMLEVEDWGDGDVYLSCWRLATPRHEYGTLGHRLREAWRLLRGWDVAGDDYVLDRDGARKLAAALSTCSGAASAEDLSGAEDESGAEHWLHGAGFGGTEADDPGEAGLDNGPPPYDDLRDLDTEHWLRDAGFGATDVDDDRRPRER